MSAEKGDARMRASQATPEPGEPIALDLVGGDVWAWEKEITGRCPGIRGEASIELLVNDESILAKRDGDRFGATVRLAPGANTVTAIATLANGDRVSSEPVIHTVRLSPRPTSRVLASIENNAVVLDGGASTPSEFDGSPISSWRWRARPENPARIQELATLDGTTAHLLSMAATLTVRMPEHDGEYYVSLEVTDEEGRTDTGTACFVVEGGVPRIVDPLKEEAGWIGAAVVYGMVVRNFTSSGFRGVTARLQELADLGITAIWFAPITRTPEGDFGYAVTDYFAVRPEYGSLEDFRTLVDRAHAHGIRVLMDFVPNHTSAQHPYFIDAETHGESSPYFHFYERSVGGDPTHYFEWSHLPNLNFEHLEVRRFITEAFTFWVREYDVDGFRVDVAWGIKERRPEYWLEWSAELNRIKPDLLLIAEASARDPFYVHNGFDAAYDWTNELGVWAWGDAFALGFPLSTVMADALTNMGEGYDPDSLILRFLNNNDTGLRFISVYGVGRYRAALAMLMTLPGIPCIYTGDEVGAEFLPYETADEIDWTDSNDLRPYVERLVHLRRSHPSLYSRTWTQLEVDPPVECFGYLRVAEHDAPIVVIINYSPEHLDAQMVLPVDLAGRSLTDIWTDETIEADARDPLTVSIPAWEFRVVKGSDTA